MSECRYCANDHDVRELCRPRRVGRRSFMLMLGAAAAAAAHAPVGFTIERTIQLGTIEYPATMFDAMLREIYHPLVVRDLNAGPWLGLFREVSVAEARATWPEFDDSERGDVGR